LADCQKQGGVAVLIDTENAASMEILQKCGVNLDELVYLQLGTTEEVFKAMESIIQKVRSENKKVDKNILIVWDSVAATSTGAEIAGDYGAHTIGLQARLISQGLRKIIPFIGKYNVTLLFLNQLRTKIGVMFGDPMVTPGGKAIPYFASVRVRLFKEAELKEPKTKAVQGVVVKAKVNKCKIAPPLRQASFTIRFGRGIQDIESWLDPLASFGEIQQGGGWYMYKEKRFRRADFVDFVQKNGFEEELRDLLYDHLIIKIDEDNQAIEMVDEGEKLNGEED
jgi:recombination protein RecA